MRPIEIASTRWVMQQCPFQSRLSAFYDRELDPLAARELGSHLANCPACSGELESMRLVSRLMHEAPAGQLSQMGRARLHQTAQQASRRRDVFPLARGLMAAAASVLIIAGAWLVEMPRGSAPMIGETAHSQSDWETLASGGKLGSPQNETGVASADASAKFSQWMLDGLKGIPNHEN